MIAHSRAAAAGRAFDALCARCQTVSPLLPAVGPMTPGFPLARRSDGLNKREREVATPASGPAPPHPKRRTRGVRQGGGPGPASPRARRAAAT